MIFKKIHTFLVFPLFIIILISNSYSLTSTCTSNEQIIHLKLLGINDFHGQLTTTQSEEKTPVGGASVLASYIKKAQEHHEEHTIITLMGDLVGASPPISALLQDEPTILFLNSLGNSYCTQANRLNPHCNIVATIGNHEFDKGQPALFNLIYGSINPPTDHWYPSMHYEGATYPYISANIIDEKTQKPLFPPYVIKSVGTIPIAFIGAILKNADKMSFPQHVKGIKFLDEAEAINHYIPEIKALGVKIIIVLIHEGGQQKAYEGPTQNNTQVDGVIKEIIYRLDDAVEVVMAGHTHQFLNAFIPNHNDHPILVTQANSYSRSFAEVNLDIDSKNQHIKKKEARIITTFADRWPGNEPDAATQDLIALAENNVGSKIKEFIGTTSIPLLRKQNLSGESNLGNLVADAFKAAMDADLAIHNIHGLRADIFEGTITKGDAFSALPFANTLVLVSLTGQDIYDLLEQQWIGTDSNILQVSGISYTYKLANPLGKKIELIQLNNKPINKDTIYTIATTDFLANGNGIFSVMKKGKILGYGKSDQESLIEYIKKLDPLFAVEIEGRIQRKR